MVASAHGFGDVDIGGFDIFLQHTSGPFYLHIVLNGLLSR